MADVPLPRLDEHEPKTPRGRSLLKIALEVVLIATGVFLGLAGEQWRENARHRELAHASLRRFRSEILTNRKARRTVEVHLRGLQPAFLEHTAWDLALATQSLADIDPPLAFSLSRIYGVQEELAELTRGITQAMYLRSPTENEQAFLGAVAVYYGDVVVIEPKLLGMYDELLPRIDRALGESSADKNASP